MFSKIIRRACVLGLFVFSLGASAEIELKDDEAVNDGERISRLNERLSEWKDAGTLTPFSDLTGQLSRRSAPGVKYASDVKELTPAQTYDLRRDAVVVIAGIYNCGKCHKWHIGSTAAGCVISPDGLVVTNRHVFENKENIEGIGVMTYDGRCYPVAEVLAAAEKADVLLLRLDVKDGKPLPFIPLGAKAQTGDETRVISHPAGAMFTFTQGAVARYASDPRQGAVWMSITADFARGSSGGAVLDSRGNLIGVVANTRTITYGADQKGESGPVQMVMKNCVPVDDVIALFEQEKTSVDPES